MEARIPVIGDIRETRGNGGNRIVKDPESREPDKAKAAGIAAYANQNGLLLLTAGINGNYDSLSDAARHLRQPSE